MYTPNSLPTISKNNFGQRIARVKQLFNAQPNIKQRVLLKWNDERPDLARLKSEQLMVRIAIDYLKKYEEWKKEASWQPLPHMRNDWQEMSVMEYEMRLNREGCPIPKSGVKRRKYEDAMAERRDFQESGFYDDDE
jgi:hypothetical protein